MQKVLTFSFFHFYLADGLGEFFSPGPASIPSTESFAMFFYKR